MQRTVLMAFQPWEGGVVRHVCDLAEAMIDRCWRVAILGPTERIERLQRLKETAGSSVQLMDPGMVREPTVVHDLCSLSRILEALRTIQPQVLHVHSSKAGGLGRLAAVLSGWEGRVVYTPHAYAFLGKSRWSVVVSEIERCLQRVGVTIAVSDSERHAAVAAGLDGTRITTIPNGVPVPPWRGLRRGDGRVVVGTAGRMAQQKNPECFLHTAATVCERDTRIHFVWLGDGPFAGGLNRLRAS